MEIACIYYIDFEINVCMREKKERRAKFKFSRSLFSTVKRINGTVGIYVTVTMWLNGL